MLLVKWLQVLAGALLRVASSVAGEEEPAGLTPDQVPAFLKKGIFIIQSDDFNSCVKVGISGLFLEDCSQLSKHMLWKWGSNQRLLNIGRSMCLGLNISNQEQPLVMSECDSVQLSLGWNCHGKGLVGASQYKLAVESGKFIVAKSVSSYGWKPFMSHDGDVCELASKEMYTLLGNSFGLPCVFPFKYNNTWHHECVRDSRKDGYPWCATTSHYERDERWGLCPNSESGCDILWKMDVDTKICYQFNLLSVLSWNEARVSCQAQGADLLSITDVAEQKHIGDLSEHLDAKGILMWTGLNQLDETAGWMWSDGSPLALVNWGSDPTGLEQHRCKALNPKGQHDWQSYPCESGLPYICKKYLNATQHGTFDSWKFYPTNCDYNWYPYNRYCYKLYKEEKNWDEASFSCQDDNSTLISLTSLADTEMLINLLEYENVNETWIGLSDSKTPVEFEWSDGSSVTFTYWDKQEPNIHPRKKQLCVSAQQYEGRWKVKSCKDRYFYICRRAGTVRSLISEAESGCPEGWERHGRFCYTVDITPRSFQHASSGYYCPSLATVSNRFEQAFLTSMIRNMVKMDIPYFWIALRDMNHTGEYAWLSEDGKTHWTTYTNWKKYQPRYSGGCAVMRQEKPIGAWEVKNCTSFKAMSLCKQEAKFHRENHPKEAPHIGKPFDSCMFGWESSHNLPNCYKVFHSEKVLMKRSWADAETLCQDFGAHLASFTHAFEEDFLNELLNTMFHIDEERQFWIGLNKRNPLSGGSWEWSDGTPVASAFLENTFMEDNVRSCAAYEVNGTVLPLPCSSEREWICKIPKGVKPKIPQWYINEPSWFYYQGAEYLFYDSASDWATFQFVCGWLRGAIATIHSSQEQEFILTRFKKISKASPSWWIALHWTGPNEEFRWADGSPLVYQKWEQDEKRPEITQGEKCGFISSQTGYWGFADCTISLPCICKRKKIWSVEREIPKEQNLQGTCPKGWLYFAFKCFLVQIPKDPSHLKSWHSAQAFCNHYDASLASIESEVEQAFITMNLFGHKSHVWIGLKSKDNKRWINGQEDVEYSNWAVVDAIQNQQDDSADTQEKVPLCPLILNKPGFNSVGKWYLENCEEHHGFICQKAQDTSRHVIDPSRMFPIPDTLEYANRTYTLISGNMTWYMASESCKEKGAELVSITNHYHQAFLTVIVNRLGYAHWIGLFTSDNGLHFEWSDGTKPFLTFWGDEESQTSGGCVYIDVKGNWRRTGCARLLNGAVCHLSPKWKTRENKGLCDEKTVPWIKFESSCYSFSTVLENLNFDEAFEFCKMQGSDLLTIKDEDENTFILEELYTLTSVVEMIWLNTGFLTDNSTLVSLDGSPVRYVNWGVKEPILDQIKGNVCIALRTADGVWQLASCQERKGFVCKKNTDVPEITIQSVTVSTRRIVVLIILSILVTALSAVSACIWCLHAPSCLFRRIQQLRNARPVEASSEDHAIEESILISNLERNDDLQRCNN